MSALQSGTRRGRADGDTVAGPAADRRARPERRGSDGGREGRESNGPHVANGQRAAPTAVPYQLANPAGAPIALDIPFTGALGPIGTKEDWFTPARAEPPETEPPENRAPTDPEEDA
jgi:hypothetical protein